jgi:hypothetical protein
MDSHREFRTKFGQPWECLPLDWDHKQVQESTLTHVHVQQLLVEAGRSEVMAVDVKVTGAPKCMF